MTAVKKCPVNINFSDTAIANMYKSIDRTNKTELEYGGILESKEKLSPIELKSIATGFERAIMDMRKPHDIFKGEFHTHNNHHYILPSPADLMRRENKGGISCIGAPLKYMKNKVKCCIIKSENDPFEYWAAYSNRLDDIQKVVNEVKEYNKIPDSNVNKGTYYSHLFENIRKVMKKHFTTFLPEDCKDEK